MDDAQRAQVLMGAGYVFGASGALAPGVVSRLFGIKDSSGEMQSTVRMMSFRNVALAAVLTGVADDEAARKRFFTIGAALFAADTVATILAAVKGKVSPRTAVMLGGTTAALAAVAATGATG